LKPEKWGSPLIQEKYQGEKACDNNYNTTTNNNNKKKNTVVRKDGERYKRIIIPIFHIDC
jgi:hypothetical protein